MRMKVIGSAMVKPATATPTTAMYLSNLDMLRPTIHVPTVYFYRSSGAHDFFDAAIFKASLSRALVEFYPLAGRLNEDVNGRVEINCSAEGALFVEAECDGAVVDDFADGKPKPEIDLVPQVDYSQGISTFPLLLVQITRFNCGGVSFGFSYEHHVMDGFAKHYFIATWAEIARGVNITTKPFLDRRILAARNPPQPQFPHVEYLPSPTLLENTIVNSKMILSILKLTRDKINALKAKCQEDEGNTVKYTTFETLAGHVWRCLSKARGLPKDQETRVSIPVDGRSRLLPPLPRGYFGNVVFSATGAALCGELESNSLEFAVRRVHNAIARMDDNYLRSAIDHLEEYAGVVPFERSPNLRFVSWEKFGFYDVDFGWGCPLNLGFGGPLPSGVAVLLRSSDNDGSLLLAIDLPKTQKMLFEKLFYDI